MTIHVTPVTTRRQRRTFARFPWRVYQNDPHWVPPILAQRKAYLNQKPAFFQYGEGQFFLAHHAHTNQPLGTIGLAINHARNRKLNQQRANFGFFEVLPGQHAYDTAAALWDHAVTWSRNHQMPTLVGPYSFAYNDDPGFLIEGHDSPPSIMMGHTPPTYAQYAEQYGFVKHADSMAYRIDFADYNFDPANIPPLILRIAERARKRLGEHVVRTVRLDDWDAEIGRAVKLFNRSLSVLEDWTPIEETEFRRMADSMRQIIDPDLILIAEMDGKTVGFAVGLPNISEALHHANGLQTPLDYIRLLRHRRKVTGASYKIMAIDPDYWSRGIDVLMYLHIGPQAAKKGYTWLDISLTAETNPTTHKIARRFGAELYKRYRVYKLPIT